MSGPKCSELDIERQTKERIGAIRKQLTDVVAQALCELKTLEEKSRAYAGSHPGLADAFREMEGIVERASADVRASGRLELGSDIPAAERRLREAEARARDIVTDARRAMAPYVERVRLSRESDADRRSVSDFSRAISQDDAVVADVTAALDALLATRSAGPGASHSGGRPNAVGASAPLGSEAFRDGRTDAQGRTQSAGLSPAAPEMISELADALEDARRLVSRSQTLESDRADLSGVARAIRRAVEGAKKDGRALTSNEAEGLLAQTRIVRSRISAQEAPLAKALARIDALESSLGGTAGMRPPSFGSADAVFARLDSLEALARENDERRYIRACVDDVMRKHGYDVVRSVDFSEAASAGHFVFTCSAEAGGGKTGIHAFIADSGDMMLEVVGVCEDGKVGRDRMDAVSDAAQQDELLSAQTRFCSVYAEMEEDLARLGIVNKVRHKAPPDVRHCKKISLAGARKTASTDVRAVRPATKTESKAGKARVAKATAKAQGAARPPADADSRRRPTQRRRAEGLRARKMR